MVDSARQALYRERAEQLDNNVRLCTYKRDRVQGGGGAASASASDAALDVKHMKAGIDDLLRAKLEVCLLRF